MKVKVDPGWRRGERTPEDFEMSVWKELEVELGKGRPPELPPPAISRRISDIGSPGERVRVVGKVVNLGEGELVLDDGSGTLKGAFEDPSLIKEVGLELVVRAFGSPLDLGGDFELHADIIQSLEGLDMELYGKVRREVKRFWREVRNKARKGLNSLEGSGRERVRARR